MPSRLAAREALSTGRPTARTWLPRRRRAQAGGEAGLGPEKAGQALSLPAFPERESQDSAIIGGSAGAPLNSGSDTEEFTPRFWFSLNASVVPMSLELVPVGP